MKELIEALQIIAKYYDDPYPICCEHDVMCLPDVNLSDFSFEEIKRLIELGFIPGDAFDSFYEADYGIDDWETLTEESWNAFVADGNNCLYSYKYGSC